MADFPTALNELTDDVGTTTTPLSTGHVDVHTELATVLEAVMAKLGIDGSAVTTSVDYVIKNKLAPVRDLQSFAAAGT